MPFPGAKENGEIERKVGTFMQERRQDFWKEGVQGDPRGGKIV